MKEAPLSVFYSDGHKQSNVVTKNFFVRPIPETSQVKCDISQSIVSVNVHLEFVIK